MAFWGRPSRSVKWLKAIRPLLAGSIPGLLVSVGAAKVSRKTTRNTSRNSVGGVGAKRMAEGCKPFDSVSSHQRVGDAKWWAREVPLDGGQSNAGLRRSNS